MTILRNKSKSKVSTIALVLVLTIAAMLVALPVANVEGQYKTKKTYAYIIVTPNPVGKGQTVLLIFGISDYLYQYPDGWENITITVEKPDNTTEKLGPFKTDSTGATGILYMPDKVGTYYFQAHFPGQWYTFPATPRAPTVVGTIWFEASDSEKVALIVQEEPLPSHPGFELPTEYWARPIDAQLREWSSIAGSWLTDPPNLFAPYNQGPETPHILWAEPLAKGAISPLGGGVAGGDIGYYGFETGAAYEGLFGQRVIIGGVLYFNRYKADGSTRVEQEVVAVNLRTGEELWVRNWNNTRLAFGQVFYWDSFNYHGVFAYLIATRTVAGVTYWDFYEASTGRWVFSYSNVPSGTRLYGPNGEIIIYTVNQARGWMTKWNSTHVVTQKRVKDYGPTGSRHGSWIREYMGTTLDARFGIMWNKTIPKGLPGSVWTVFCDDMVVGNEMYGTGFHMVLGDMPLVFWAIDLKPGREGTLLYNVTWQKPLGDIAMWRYAICDKERVFVFFAKETRQFYGFDLDTGKKIWGPTEPLDTRAFYGVSTCIAYGKLITVVNYGGLVNCFDVKTGELLWTYEIRDPYGISEMWQKEFGGDMWPMRILFITDGKVYLAHSEHSPNSPAPRGAPFICLDVKTGEEIFRVDGLLRQASWTASAVIGDSIIALIDSYDQRIYAIGRGPSATTVSIQNDVITQGSSVLIKGMVTDVSPGTNDPAIKLRFPNGVPAVADENMGDWMLYVYKQFPRPSDVKGVEVTIDAIGPDGKWIRIGTVTSDSSGMFSCLWTPPAEGVYTIVATFAGSKSYWPSYAQTAVGVTAAPPNPEMPEIPTPTDYTPMLTGLTIAVVIAIVIGVANLYALRKRK